MEGWSQWRSDVRLALCPVQSGFQKLLLNECNPSCFSLRSGIIISNTVIFPGLPLAVWIRGAGQGKLQSGEPLLTSFSAGNVTGSVTGKDGLARTEDMNAFWAAPVLFRHSSLPYLVRFLHLGKQILPCLLVYTSTSSRDTAQLTILEARGAREIVPF